MSHHGPEEPLWVRADANRLGQVLANLFTNACKFTPENGNVFIELKRNGDHAIIEFRDSGIGIAPENLEKIFDPFEQVGNGGESNPGLGIGLSLVKGLVEKHGGSVRASSEGEGEGATFTVELPCVPNLDEEIQSGDPEIFRIKPGLKVLIVDDNREAAEGLASILEMESCQVVQAHSAEIALESLAAFDAEVLLIDIDLGGSNGCDLLGEITARHGKKATAVAITGFGHEEARQRTAEAGFDDHFNKPPDIDRLLKVIAERS